MQQVRSLFQFLLPFNFFEFNQNKVCLIKSKGRSFKYTARVLVITDIIWSQRASEKRGRKVGAEYLFFFYRSEFILRREERWL